MVGRTACLSRRALTGAGLAAAERAAPAGTPGPVRSRYRHRRVHVVVLIPAAAPPGPLGLVVALHALGGDARAAARLYRPAMAAAGIRTLAVACVDGGVTYWHRRRDGDDPLAMIVHEVLPRAAASGLAVSRIGIAGYSMGGYGALLLAERLGSGRAAAVAAASPAIFATYAGARSADPGAFDGPSDFARNDVFGGLAALRGVRCRVSCGSIDPFAATAAEFRVRLRRVAGQAPAGGIVTACHDGAFWAREAPAQLRFLSRALSRRSGTA